MLHISIAIASEAKIERFVEFPGHRIYFCLQVQSNSEITKSSGPIKSVRYNGFRYNWVNLGSKLSFARNNRVLGKIELVIPEFH